MKKKEKWITLDADGNAEVEKFSIDPLKFGSEILYWFCLWDEIKDWEKMHEQDNSKKIEDYIKEITNGKIEYDWNNNMFLESRTRSYIKTC